MNSLHARPDTGIAVVPSLDARDASAAFYHQALEAVRFWAPIADGFVSASVFSAVLQYRFRPPSTKEEPIQLCARHAAELGAAVQWRVAQDSVKPVMRLRPEVRRRRCWVEPRMTREIRT